MVVTSGFTWCSAKKNRKPDDEQGADGEVVGQVLEHPDLARQAPGCADLSEQDEQAQQAEAAEGGDQGDELDPMALEVARPIEGGRESQRELGREDQGDRGVQESRQRARRLRVSDQPHDDQEAHENFPDGVVSNEELVEGHPERSHGRILLRATLATRSI
jgi:hypothetical protein